MIISYKTEWPWGGPTNFKQKILDGIKIHTIRTDPHNRWHEGRKAHHAHGVRTKNYHCFKEDVCRGVQNIKIIHCPKHNTIELFVDGLCYYSNKYYSSDMITWIKKFSKNDGFDSIEDFLKWFNTDFTGKIIHSTDFRY